MIDGNNNKNLFLNIISHEIKGPLANTIYILRLLKDQLESDTINTHQALQYINAEIHDAHRGIEIINYLQKLLTLNNARSEDNEHINIKKELIDIIDVFENNNEKNLLFHLVKDENVPHMIVLNRSIFEVVKLLLKNAVKYSPNNAEINVYFSHQTKNSQNYLNIVIEDNGNGINEEALSTIFLPMLSDIDGDNKHYKSPAIKLSYAKKLITTLNGELNIKNKAPHGLIAAISVPYTASNRRASFAISPLYDEKPSNNLIFKKLNFLIVEDNPVTAQLLSEELKNLSHSVDTAHNAITADELLNKNNYDIIFMDISLPGTDGIELRKYISQRNPNSDLPIIVAITSHCTEAEIEYFVDEGFATVISKPFTKEDIRDCVEALQRVLEDLEREDKQIQDNS